MRFIRIHNWLRVHNKAYYTWHTQPWASFVHWCILILFLLLIASLILTSLPTRLQAASLTIQPGNDGQDSWAEYLTESNHGSEATMQVYASGGAGGHFSFMTFPLSSIPEGSTITNATLTLTISSRDEYGSQTLRLNRVTAAWDESTILWSNQPSIESGGSYQTDLLSTHGPGDTVDFSITSLVSDWRSGTIPNYGLRLGFSDFTPINHFAFHTSEATTASLRPKLVITYTGGAAPTPTPTPVPTAVPGSPATATPTATAAPTTITKVTPTPTSSHNASPSPSTEPSSEPTTEPTPEASPSTSASPTAYTSPPANPPTLIESILAKIGPASAAEKATAGVLVGAIVTLGTPIASFAVSLVQSLLNLPQLVVANWLNFLAVAGLRKKRYPWGRVLDSTNSEPISSAIVTIHDQDNYGRLVERTLTDKNGRYGFFVEPGHYSLWVKKAGYTFPSRVITEAYHGQTFIVGDERMIVVDLLCDRNDHIKTWIQWVHNRALQLELFRFPLLIFGSLLSIALIISDGSVITYAMAILYAVLWAYEIKNRHLGRHTFKILDKYQPLAFTVFRIINPATKQTVITKATNDKGEAFVLLESGNYIMQITHPFTREVIERPLTLTQGIALQEMTIQVGPDPTL